MSDSKYRVVSIGDAKAPSSCAIVNPGSGYTSEPTVTVNRPLMAEEQKQPTPPVVDDVGAIAKRLKEIQQQEGRYKPEPQK